jgi:hypothetical protein
MALGTPTHLTAASTQTASAVSPSFTPTADALIVVTAAQRWGTALPHQPTFSGGGLTWTTVDTVFFDIGASARVRCTVAVAPSSPVPMTVTVDQGSSGAKLNFSVDQIPGASASITNFDGATDGTGDVNVTLPDPPTTGNWVFAAGAFGGTAAMGPPASFTEIFEGLSQTDLIVHVNYRADDDLDTADWTSTNSNCAAVIMEVAPTVVAPAAVPRGQSIFIG